MKLSQVFPLTPPLGAESDWDYMFLTNQDKQWHLRWEQMCSVRIHIISVALLVSDGMFALTPLAPCNCQHQIQFSTWHSWLTLEQHPPTFPHSYRSMVSPVLRSVSELCLVLPSQWHIHLQEPSLSLFHCGGTCFVPNLFCWDHNNLQETANSANIYIYIYIYNTI